MANKVEFTYASRDGINKVHAIKWIPEEKPVKAIVQIVHGMIEYIDRYEAFANYLVHIAGLLRPAGAAEKHGFCGRPPCSDARRCKPERCEGGR